MVFHFNLTTCKMYRSSFTGIVGATPLRMRTTVSDGALQQQLIRLVTDQRVV